MRLQTAAQVGRALSKGNKLSVRELYGIWEQRLPVSTARKANKSAPQDVIGARQIGWLQSKIALSTAFTEQALQKEEYLLVCDAFREAAAYWQGRKKVDQGELLRLHSLYASAKTRLGFTRAARHSLEPLVGRREIGRKEQARILLQLGDIVREESLHLSTAAARTQTAHEAQKFYQKALKLDARLLEAHVSNAAMALILSERGTARRRRAQALGRSVLRRISREARAGRDDALITQFKAVAFSVIGDLDKAAAEYGKLQTCPEAGTAMLAEARYRAQFLAEAWGLPRDYFKPAFPSLQLLVFAGHLPDTTTGPRRFPQESIPVVREMLRRKLDELQARVGLVSAAAGADLLFIEALRARPGTKFHIVLPWSKKEFLRTSVERYDSVFSPTWTPLFEQAIEHAATVRELGQLYEPADDVGWEYAQEVTAGLALRMARVSRLDVQPIALWDGRGEGMAGGTASFVKFWSDLGKPPIVLDLPYEPPLHAMSPQPRRARVERDSLRLEVKSILFADIVGYSKLTEKVIRELVEIFFEEVSKLIALSSHAPCSVNTWGDALYCVFDYAQDAGRFALQLTQMVRDNENKWLERGLFYEEHDAEEGKVVKRPLNIRVGLHTGPIFAHYDPIKRHLGFTGSHVNRAARIEPIAAIGEVYASEEFAAMSELGNQAPAGDAKGGTGRRHEGDGFVCEYAGSMSLAKDYPGRYPIYRVIPVRVLAMEDLARAAHESYCLNQLRNGPPDTNALALRPWNELSEDFRNANRAQVADLPNKLYLLGYELAPSHGLSPQEIKISKRQLEDLARREHERWVAERQREGWSHGPARDSARKLHPSLLPWSLLPESEKQKDRDSVAEIPALIRRAGFRVRKLARSR